MVGDLTWARGSYSSMHGRVESHWRREADTLRLEVTIPANTIATVHVPTTQPSAVTESGRPAGKVEGVTFLRAGDSAAVYEVRSGHYVFESVVMRTAEPLP